MRTRAHKLSGILAVIAAVVTSLAVIAIPYEVVISIADQGIGISAEDQQHLFEPFRRVGPSKQTIPGLGLGLFVVSRIVEAHGGRIEVESRPSRGATFRVHLPATASERHAAPAGTREDEDQRRQPIH